MPGYRIAMPETLDVGVARPARGDEELSRTAVNFTGSR